MRTITFSRPGFWGIVILLGIGILLPARSLPAQGVGCSAVDLHDMPRSCTFLEEHGACLWYALDSYEWCKETGDGFWDRAACEVGVQVDLLACNIQIPWRLIESILR
jgi:hypothetical protein